MMDKRGIGTFRVAATYIGTVVGAGFASGQEVLQFFSNFGVFGAAGLALVTVLFIVFGQIIMDYGRKLNARSHLEIIRFAGGRIPGTIVDMIIIFFLFGGLSTMIAGTGALFEQQFHLPALLGNSIMAIITAATVLTGIRGVINSISLVVPFLLASVIGISIFVLADTPPDLSSLPPATENGVITNWLMAAVLYVSYNTVISVAVLGPLGAQTRHGSTVAKGALLGGLGLGASSLMIYLAISGNIAGASGVEVPMLYLAGTLGPLIQIFYAVILAAEIYTTAVGSLFGFTARFTDIEHSSSNGRFLAVAATLAAFWASQLGFSNMVKYLYPVVGYAGILLLILLVYSKIKNKNSKLF
jgi:uncharacterized membrane protein YkvI